MTSRSIAAAAAAIAAMPPILCGSAPSELTTVLTNAKMRMLAWAFTVAPEVAAMVHSIVDAGDLAPMLDCDALERQLAGQLDAERVTEGMGSVVGMVAKMVSGRRHAGEAVVHRIAEWRRTIDESHAQLLAMRGDAASSHDAVHAALDRVAASIDDFRELRGRPRVVLVWLSNLEAVAFGLVADDEAAAALTEDAEVLETCRVAAEEFAAADERERCRVLLDAALSTLAGASANAQRLEELASDTAAAWQPIEERLARTSSGDAPESHAAVRTAIARAREDVQSVHAVQESFRVALVPLSAIVTEPVELRPGLARHR